MPRDFVCNGEALVRVKFGQHLLSMLPNPNATSTLFELGLASEGIRISPVWKHTDVHIDDFGPDVPVEVLWMLATVNVDMTLIHYDPVILDLCMSEAMGGIQPGPVPGTIRPAGTMVGAGTPLGNMLPPTASGNHLVSVNLLSPVLNFPWRFRSAYLAAPPLEIPVGVKATAAVLSFRCLPYPSPPAQSVLTTNNPILGAGGGQAVLQAGGLPVNPGYPVPSLTPGELVSSGTVLWDRFLDV